MRNEMAPEIYISQYRHVKDLEVLYCCIVIIFLVLNLLQRSDMLYIWMKRQLGAKFEFEAKKRKKEKKGKTY